MSEVHYHYYYDETETTNKKNKKLQQDNKNYVTYTIGIMVLIVLGIEMVLGITPHVVEHMTKLLVKCAILAFNIGIIYIVLKTCEKYKTKN